MNEITPDILNEFKERMHISHSAEDANLTRLLKTSLAYAERVCGVFDVTSHDEARELIFERSRYAYNDSLEFFETNFLSMIQGLSLSLLPEVVEEDVIV
ncbi:head-tail connector protein [Planococcus kocurii]|uniref:head-tail connector protein n=1 Tax=Planococcus kocurii TaxID=1374 RepID=UPI003CFEDDFE